MAKARPALKKRRIVITKPQEDKGDIQISLSEARFRLTAKFFITLLLLIAAGISVVVVATRYGRRSGPASAPDAARSADATDQQAQTRQQNRPPQVLSAAIVPEQPGAASKLDVKYEAVDPDGDPITFLFRWLVNGTVAQEGASSELREGSFRAGDVVAVEVVPSDQQGPGAAVRSAAVTIGKTGPVIRTISLRPDPASIGDMLSASVAVDNGTDAVVTYQWQVNGDARGPAGPAATFDTNGLRKRDVIAVVATASREGLTSASIRSNPVSLSNRKPEIVSSPPTTLTGTSYSYQVVAKDPDGDAVKYRLELAPAGMTIDASTGMVQWSLNKGMYSGRNEALVRVIADDGDGGTASQEFTITFSDLYVQ